MREFYPENLAGSGFTWQILSHADEDALTAASYVNKSYSLISERKDSLRYLSVKSVTNVRDLFFHKFAAVYVLMKLDFFHH